ncbi:UNVERIFIED_CONTAM: hypothetical protein FKN15_004833 [Acipenser sinensis]
MESPGLPSGGGLSRICGTLHNPVSQDIGFSGQELRGIVKNSSEAAEKEQQHALVETKRFRFGDLKDHRKKAMSIGAGGREAVASEPALTPEHALTTEHNTAQRTPHNPPRRRAQFRARRIVV